MKSSGMLVGNFFFFFTPKRYKKGRFSSIFRPLKGTKTGRIRNGKPAFRNKLAAVTLELKKRAKQTKSVYMAQTRLHES